MDIFRRRRKNPWITPAIILLVMAAGGVAWYYASSDSTQAVAASAPANAAIQDSATTSSSTGDDIAPAAEPAETPAKPAAESTSEISVSPAPSPAATPSSPAAAAPATPTETASTPATPATPAATTSPTAAIAARPTTSAIGSGTVVSDAQRLMSSGDLEGARQALNPAITSGMLPLAEQRAAMQLLEQINKTLIFSPRRLPQDTWSESYLVKPGDMLQKIAPRYGTTAKFIQRINNISNPTKLRAGQTIKIVKGPFHAVVSKTTFTIDLYLGSPGGEGSLYVCSFPVGLGQDDSTPLGTWQVAPGKKLVNPKYYDPRGGRVIEPDDPTNPLGEYWIGLTGTEGNAVGKMSYGIHGTIEPDSIGKMASMGCVRLRNEDVAVVYEMLIEGKSIVIVKP